MSVLFYGRLIKYKPASPSAIVDMIKTRSNVRQVPTEGLHVDQMSFALRELGFGTKVYTREDWGDVIFQRLFSTYVESGLPLIIIINNCADIVHALLVIGHEPTMAKQIDALPVAKEYDPYIAEIIEEKGIRLYDNDDINRQFVFVDDNLPPYQLQHYHTPAAHYNDPDWAKCKVSNVIVPLYPKMYLEADQAKRCIKELLLSGRYLIENSCEIFLRVFMTSSRSYKDYVARDVSFDKSIKDIILNIPMSRFIWIGELSDKSGVKQKLAHGLFILDATEPYPDAEKGLIFGGYGNCIYYSKYKENNLIVNTLYLNSYNIYQNNLKGF